MIIGYHHIGGQLDLFRSDTLASITDVTRLPRIRSMIEQGHEIVLLSPLSTYDEKIYKSYKRGGTLLRLPDFLNGIRYPFFECKKPEDFIKILNEIDVLFLECGPTNTTYGGVFDLSYWEFLGYLLRNYEGTVIYFQNDAVLTFPFGELLSNTPIENVSPRNLRRIVQTSKIFDNKKWVILHHALDEKYWIENSYTRNGKTYAEVYDHFSDSIRFRYIPHPYDEYALTERYNPALFWLPNAKGSKYDVVWIGSRYSSGSGGSSSKIADRLVYLKRFLFSDIYKMVVIGRQWEDYVKKYPDTFLGAIGDIRTTSVLYQRALSTIILDSEITIKSGYFSFRLYESIFFGTLPMIDSKYELLNKLIGIDEIVVDSPEDVRRVLDWWKEMTDEEKTNFRRELLSKFPKYSDIVWKEYLKF